ncbi:MAG: trypsin-like peptidase domain-containing protein [Novosphingobium sp.]|uniref:S1C family serine protease n=1 Tax=Novosphingobium sp. TaxID=1874826 RepID=UPI00261178DE|nr:serine protease [Novosphingobium sp.]MCP5385256.1 trypsin-like peptidase domain-containing protein [Novosphingobium sp.]
MHRILALLAALVAFALPGPLAADPADITAASRSVVRVALVSIDGRDASLVGHGSGFAVAPDLIVTNAHVIADMAEDDTLQILIIPPQGQRGWGAKVVAFSPRNDLALLKVIGGTLPVSTLAPAGVSDGAPVFAVGYPGSVDFAQGFDEVDMITPVAPVKTQGTVSAGRPSKTFATVLHTASIGGGNSGGPLMDACGRVIGANSFGTISDGSDSEFFFAVAASEIVRFLRDNKVTPRLASLPCQSMDTFNQAQAAMAADDKAKADEATRTAEAGRQAADAKAARTAELQILSERENGLVLAALVFLAALGAGGAAFYFHGNQDQQRRKYALAVAVVLFLGALYAWFSRPGIDQIDARAAELTKAGMPSDATSEAPELATGALRCVLDPQHSRVTVSDIADVPLRWTEDGCVNARSQYGLAANGWSRILVPNAEDTVTVARFDPATSTYTTERYLLDLETMTKAREERARYDPPKCGGGEEAARKLGEAQGAVAALLPAQPNERLVYKCSADPSSASQ